MLKESAMRSHGPLLHPSCKPVAPRGAQLWESLPCFSSIPFLVISSCIYLFLGEQHEATMPEP